MSNTPETVSSTTTIPPRPQLHTAWDLTQYYSSVEDKKIEADVAKAEKLYETFANTYSDGAFVRSAPALATALTDYIALLEKRPYKPLYYLTYCLELNASDTKAEQKRNLLESRMIQAANKALFFPLAIIRIPEAKQAKFLKSPALQPYRYMLEELFKETPHTLSEPEERILSLKSQPAQGMWVSGTEKILANRSITYKREQLPLLGAIEKIDSLSSKEKPKLWQVITDELATCEEVVENELTAIVTDKKISDDLRGYARPQDATIRSYENDPATVDALVAAVSSTGYKQSRAFYKLKADFHELDTLPYVNRYDKITTMPSFSYEEAVDLVREAFYDTKVEYGELFDKLISRGQVDVYPKQGKQGGAFMSAGVNEPIMVKLNHVDTTNSLKTLAHEMGHAIHTDRTQRTQPSHYQDYSTTIAETASTFFEAIIFSALYERSKPKVQMGLLHDNITQSIATIQRQIAFYNFECKLHEQVRTQGAASQADLRAYMQNELAAYHGPRVSVTEADARTYVYVGHFRMFFYVYSYAYGELVSSLMYQKYQADPSYIDVVDTFLCAGGSASVEDLCKHADIDVYDTETFASGLRLQQQQITDFRRALKNTKAK